MDGVLKLRRGGVHSSKKGTRGYSRSKEKEAGREEDRENPVTDINHLFIGSQFKDTLLNIKC